jgi:hypothetical protein
MVVEIFIAVPFVEVSTPTVVIRSGPPAVRQATVIQANGPPGAKAYSTNRSPMRR